MVNKISLEVCSQEPYDFNRRRFSNWIVRLKNKNFWIALIPAVIVLVQQVVKTFGIQIDLGELGNNLLDIVNSVFIILAILGIVVDPTTDGIKDSARALTYNEPKKDDEK